MKVFLSHNKKDRNIALKIANDLKSKRIEVWIDEWEIFVGDSIINEIEKGLQSSDFLSILFTRNSLESKWVEQEWQSYLSNALKNKRITILPLKGDDCEIPYFLNHLLFADFSKDYFEGINQLMQSIYHNIRKIDQENNNQIEIKLLGDINRFNNNDKEKLLNPIKELLGYDNNIEITKDKEDGIKVKLNMSDAQTKTFFQNLNRLMAKNKDIQEAWLIESKQKSDKNKTFNKRTQSITKIEKTSTSPAFLLNSETGEITLSGRSIMEDPDNFYDKLYNLITDYVKHTILRNITFNVDFEYFNSGSSKSILQILKLFKSLVNISVKINWYFEEGDEVVLELGKYFKNLCHFLDFNLIEKPELN